MMLWKSALKALLSTDAVSGREQKRVAFLVQSLRENQVSVQTDPLGNVIAHLPCNQPNAKKVALCVSMDEIGFLVTDIDKTARVHFCRSGSFSEKDFLGCAVRTQDGTVGILRADDAEKESLFFDLGTTKQAQAQRYAPIGSALAFLPSYHRLAGGKLLMTGLTGRLGVALLLSLATDPNLPSLACDVTILFCVQGHLGARGAVTALFEKEVDLALFLGYAQEKEGVKMGKGAVIVHRDRTTICDVPKTQNLIQLAKQESIPYQHTFLCESTTELGAFQKADGGRSLCSIAIPIAYKDTPAETVMEKDVEAVRQLLYAFLQSHSETRGAL